MDSGPEQHQQQRQRQQRQLVDAVRAEAVAAAASCAPNWWTQQLLLFTALNAAKERQLELVLMAVKEAREFAAAERGGSKRHPGSGGKPAWDGRTRHAIAVVIRQSEQARALLGDGVAAAAAEEREERLQQLKGLLS